MIQSHHPLPRENLISQRIFKVAREVCDLAEVEYDRVYSDLLWEMGGQIEVLQRENAILKGEEPPPLVAYAEA